MFHNESLALIDVLLAGAITAGPLSMPPASPANGATYLVAATGAAGAFEGKENQLAAWTAAGWRFLVPVEGMRLTDRPSGAVIEYWNGQWRKGVVRAEELVIGGLRVVGPAGAPIGAPAGGAIVDAEARGAVNAILAALRAHGLIQT